MKGIIAAVLLCAATLFAADATIVGQGPVVEQRIGWGASMSSSLYVTSTGYMRDSTGGRVAFDTSIASVGAAGACTQSIVIRSGTGVVPQAYGRLSLRIRATDVAQAGVQVYLAFRDRTPTGTDTGWVVPLRNRVYDSSYVYMTLTQPTLTTGFQTWWMNGFVAGQDVRVCVARSGTGPSTGDTVVFNNNWLRAW